MKHLPHCCLPILLFGALCQPAGAQMTQEARHPLPTAANAAPVLSMGDAVSQNNTAAVAALLRADPALVNQVTNYGTTPLAQAVQSGSQDAAKLLLAHGADITAVDRNGASLLDRIAQGFGSNSMDMLDLLLAHGASLTAFNPDGLTPLHVAALTGSTFRIQAFLDKNVAVDIKSRHGDTPLHIVAATSSYDAALLLLAHGAHVNAHNFSGDTPLQVALHLSYFYGAGSSDINSSKAGMIELLIEHGADFNARDHFGLSPLLYALVHHDVLSCAVLNQHHAAINTQTAFMKAAAQNDLATLRRLLQADPLLVTARIATGATPLHIAALWGAQESAALLLKHGADVNARDGQAQTPLHFAARLVERGPMIAWLLAHHAIISPADTDGFTPLHLAVHAGATDTVRLLLAHHAAVNALTTHGETPLEASMPQGYVGGDASTTLMRHITALLLDAGADPNIPTSYNRGSIIDRAVEASSIGLVTLLLNKGANPNGNGSEYFQYSPLMSAAQNHQTAIAALLLAHGADTTLKNLDGGTALDVAMRYHSTDIAALIRAASAPAAHP